jgi:hypothetical protein
MINAGSCFARNLLTLAGSALHGNLSDGRLIFLVFAAETNKIVLSADQSVGKTSLITRGATYIYTADTQYIQPLSQMEPMGAQIHV